MATEATTQPKTLNRSMTLEVILKQLPVEERAVVEWNISTPHRVRRLAEDAVVIDGSEGELLVAEVSPNYVLAFRERPEQYELIDLMGKLVLNWEEFPPPNTNPTKSVNGTPDARKNGKATP